MRKDSALYGKYGNIFRIVAGSGNDHDHDLSMIVDDMRKGAPTLTDAIVARKFFAGITSRLIEDFRILTLKIVQLDDNDTYRGMGVLTLVVNSPVVAERFASYLGAIAQQEAVARTKVNLVDMLSVIRNFPFSIVLVALSELMQKFPLKGSQFSLQKFLSRLTSSERKLT